MLHIDLKGEYYLEEQFDDILDCFNENGINIDEKTLRSIANGTLIVRGIDDMIPADAAAKQICNVFPDKLSDLGINDGYIGAYAIDYLFDTTGTEHFGIDAITDIDLDLEVFYECNRSMWYDISSLGARVQNRVNRLSRMRDMHAPLVIITNEYRMAYEAVNAFAKNGYNGTREIKYNDGRTIRSISDIGYSLYRGWSPQMKQYFAEKEAELEREQEEMEAEARGENNG